jgi:hypothetical protein
MDPLAHGEGPQAPWSYLVESLALVRASSREAPMRIRGKRGVLDTSVKIESHQREFAFSTLKLLHLYCVLKLCALYS